MKLAIDSSVLVAMFHAHDAHANGVHEMFVQLRARGDSITISSLVIMEVAVALARNQTLEAFPDFEKFFEDFHVLPLDAAFTAQFITALRSKPIPLKTSDMIMVRAAQWADAALITLDQQMLAQGSKYVRALTPQQYLDAGGDDHTATAH